MGIGRLFLGIADDEAEQIAERTAALVTLIGDRNKECQLLK